MFTRPDVEEIVAWYRGPDRKPLVLRGARQVGKSTAVQMAAAQLKVPLYGINLERHASLQTQFARYDIQNLLFSFSAITGEPLTQTSPGILFLDEAQATPAAYACLRYFYEDAPQLAVVLTGSLLDQVLANYRGSAPVGRVEYRFMGPVSFDEFLGATGHQRLVSFLSMLTLERLGNIPDELHQELLEQVRRYILVGGMPHAVQLAIDTKFDHAAINKYHVELLQAYRSDFNKYRGSIDGLKLNTFFDGILAQVGLQFSHKMAHKIADGSGGDNRLLNSAIEQFLEARLFYRVLHTNADRSPLGAQVKQRISKFLFLDIGLLLAAQSIPVQAVMGRPIELTNQGTLAEQFVGQHLLHSMAPFKNPELYFWHPPKSELQAEIDFLLPVQDTVVPVEVKASASGRLKSLHSYAIRKNAPLGIRIHSGQAGLETVEARIHQHRAALKLLNLPFYLVGHAQRLAREILSG